MGKVLSYWFFIIFILIILWLTGAADNPVSVIVAWISGTVIFFGITFFRSRKTRKEAMRLEKTPEEAAGMHPNQKRAKKKK